MKNIDTIRKFADQVNRMWPSGYTADLIGKHLVIYLNGEDAAQMSEEFKVVGSDSFAVENLKKMVAI